MEDALVAELRKLFESVFGRPMPQLERATRPSEVDGWHSLRHAHLIMAIEDHFGIEVPEERYSTFENFGDIVDLVAALKGHEGT